MNDEKGNSPRPGSNPQKKPVGVPFHVGDGIGSTPICASGIMPDSFPPGSPYHGISSTSDSWWKSKSGYTPILGVYSEY